MQKRIMGRTGVSTSLLGFGCMRFPRDGEKIDMPKVQQMVDYAISHGVNYFDTAYVYENSEEAIGAALRKHPRDSYFIADKLPSWCVHEEGDLEKLFNTSLERLGTDYIDFYLLHALDRSKLETIKKYNMIEFCKKKRAEGKIRFIGFSFHDSPEVLREIVEMNDWDFAQLQLNYYDWKNQQADELYDILEKKGIPCVVMEPVRGGMLANPPKAVRDMFGKVNPDRSPAAWALGFCASKPNVKVILSGMSAFDQVKENIETLGNFTGFTPEEDDVLRQAAAYLNSQHRVGCTGCGYCMPCPKGVNIPGCFSAYNDYMSFRDKEALKRTLEEELKNSGPENCIRCGACKKKCPQHLDIPNELAKLTDAKTEAGI